MGFHVDREAMLHVGADKMPRGLSCALWSAWIQYPQLQFRTTLLEYKHHSRTWYLILGSLFEFDTEFKIRGFESEDGKEKERES
jgi:hypothetical protein